MDEYAGETPSTVRITDDDPIRRQTLSHLLRHAGYAIVDERNSHGVVPARRRENLDVVLSDVGRLKVNGVRIAPVPRDAGSAPDPPVAVLSGSRERDPRSRARVRCAEGADQALYEIAGTCIPARDIGGDYFDIIPVDRDRWAICIGDVAGKGLPAAVLAVVLQAVSRAGILEHRSPAACLEHANAMLRLCAEPSEFATQWYGVLDTTRHELLYANAGHCPPVLFSRRQPPVPLQTGDMVLGALEGTSYAETRLLMQPGDLLMAYSDGLTEALNTAEEEFGVGRLVTTIQQHLAQPVPTIVDAVLEAVRAYAAGGPHPDDRTLVVLRRER